MRCLALLLLFSLLPLNASADFTLTWTPPTENTDGSPLQPAEIDGYQLWCLLAYQADGVTPRTYGNPSIQPANVTSYTRTWPSLGEWKCKLKTIHVNGMLSADSAEVFFTIADLNGDGNGVVDDGTLPPVEVPPPEPPPIAVECPEPVPAECPPVTRGNEFTVTRKGFYTISGPDRIWLTKPDGSTRQVQTRDEAYEWISKDGRSGQFIINPPPYEVFYQ